MDVNDLIRNIRKTTMKGIFARIPSDLHQEVLMIKKDTGKSFYELVEVSLRLLVAEYKARNVRKIG